MSLQVEAEARVGWLVRETQREARAREDAAAAALTAEAQRFEVPDGIG